MADSIKSTLRQFVGLLLTITLLSTASTGYVSASDGDVNYSSPYIMVDPETGKLVTVNPGPESKMHDSVPTKPSASGPADAITITGAPTETTVSTDTGRMAGTVSMIALVLAATGSVVVLASKIIRKNNPGH